jgi:hypothetical protein
MFKSATPPMLNRKQMITQKENKRPPIYEVNTFLLVSNFNAASTIRISP